MEKQCNKKLMTSSPPHQKNNPTKLNAPTTPPKKQNKENNFLSLIKVLEIEKYFPNASNV